MSQIKICIFGIVADRCPAHKYESETLFLDVMRVLLIYSNSSTELLPAPPIGLSYIATATAQAGYEVKFLDMLMDPHGMANLYKILNRYQPHVIGISVRNIDNLVHQRSESHIEQLNQQIALIRKHSDARIVLGGPAISIIGSDVLNKLDADFAILGEGEKSFPQLLNEINGNKRFDQVAGLCQRDVRFNLNIPVCPISSPNSTISSSGMENWIKWPQYQKQGATWPIQSKRGCPLSCSYCAYSCVEGESIRKRPVEEVVDEIEAVIKIVKPRTFEFVDSIFNLPKTHAIELCEEIIRRRLKVKFTAMGVNPLGASKELFTLMKHAGFNSMMITPESASDTVLEKMNKGFTREHVYRTASLASASGISSMWFFMLGAPGETRATVEQTMSFVESQLTGNKFLAMFTTGIRILPGTQLEKDCKEDGYLSPQHDLLEPTFYFSPKVSEAWILRRISRAIAKQANVVHAFENAHPASRAITDRVYRLSHMLGLAPPYWRFLPRILSIPPLPRHRSMATRRA
jgi:radical SAM superfamily enzyme YgiQ (UPF0313 family)